MWSDGCSSQFQSTHVFASMTHFDKSVQLEWHWDEVHHGKGPMDGIGEKIKRVVSGLVKSKNECGFLKELYHEDAAWLQCPSCNIWFHEECFGK